MKILVSDFTVIIYTFLLWLIKVSYLVWCGNPPVGSEDMRATTVV